MMKKEKTLNKYNHIQVPYIDEVDINELKGRHCIYLDPGKINLLYMIDDYGTRLAYSNKRRITETKRLKIQRLIKKLKEKQNVLNK